MAKVKPNQLDLQGHLITEIPILFQTEMVQGNLADMKTQTRRTKGLDGFNEIPYYWNRKDNPMKHVCRFWDGTKEKDPNPLRIEFGFVSPLGSVEYAKSIYGKPGDLLWVRETHANLNNGLANSEPFFVYKADLEHPDQHGPVTWKPSIHMPKSASRIWAMVEEIRVERLQHITKEDAKAEGIHPINNPGQKLWKGYSGGLISTTNPIMSFYSLWKSINGQESWDSNPWVWVIKYRILSKTGRPSDEVILQNHLEITGDKYPLTN